jgi:4'-phosphopantetheinyl transferase
MNVYWLEQTRVDVPADDDWLSPAEADRLARMLVPKRRDDWRLGRWTAKRALAARLGVPADPGALAKIEIRPASSGAPEVYADNRPADVTISISHRSGVGLCVVASPGVALGCDLELIEPHSDAFIADYFTGAEQARLTETSDADRFQLLALLWSAKESALKALHEGLRLDTRCVSVEGIGSVDLYSWNSLRVHYGSRVFEGWWRCAERTVRTLVAEPRPEAPIAMALNAPSPDGTFQYA